MRFTFIIICELIPPWRVYVSQLIGRRYIAPHVNISTMWLMSLVFVWRGKMEISQVIIVQMSQYSYQMGHVEFWTKIINSDIVQGLLEDFTRWDASWILA